MVYDYPMPFRLVIYPKIHVTISEFCSWGHILVSISFPLDCLDLPKLTFCVRIRFEVSLHGVAGQIFCRNIASLSFLTFDGQYFSSLPKAVQLHVVSIALRWSLINVSDKYLLFNRWNREVDSGDGAGSLPPSIIGLRGVMAEERPLVHVFVVQESMPLDALMAVSCYVSIKIWNIVILLCLTHTRLHA